MPQATIKKGPALDTCCPNCGRTDGTEMVAVLREDKQPGWLGCMKCWNQVLDRGQLNSVRQMR